MAYALFTKQFGELNAFQEVNIYDRITGAPATILTSATGGLLSAVGKVALDENGNLSVYLDSDKQWQIDLIKGSVVPAQNSIIYEREMPAEISFAEVGFCNNNVDNSVAYDQLLEKNPGSALVIRFGPGTWYFDSTLNIDGKEHNRSNITLILEAGSVIQIGPNANPGVYCKSDNCHIKGPGKIIGNLSSAGAYPSLFTNGNGILSGSATGTVSGNYSQGHAGTVTFTGLGTGWITKGTPVDIKVGTVYYRYFASSDAQINAGSANVTFNRPLEAALTTGSFGYFKNYNNRMYLATNYSAGTTTLTIQSPDVSENVSPKLMVGDQFVLHTNNNDIDSLDYSTIYTVTNTVNFTGAYPAMSAVNVTISPPLASAVTQGQMISSVQDHRNNKYTTVLFYGTNGCSVENIEIEGHRCHAIMFNATINAPWDGQDPRVAKNRNLKIKDCKAVGGGVGTLFGAAHVENFEVTGNSGKDAVKYNGAQFEHSSLGIVSNNQFDGLKEGVMVTGQAHDIQITNNVISNTGTMIDLRNIIYRIICSQNVLNCGPTTVFAIKVEAGYRPLLDDEDTSNTLSIISNNMISGTGLLSGSYNGSAIIVQPNSPDPGVNSTLRPHMVKVCDNTIYRPARHGIHVVAGAYCDVLNNTVMLPGYTGCRVETGAFVSLIGNTVVDAGQTVASSAYHLTGVAGGWFDRNRAIRIMASSPQTYGLETDNTCVITVGMNELDGSSGKYSGLTGLTSVKMGLGALRSGGNLAVGVGIEAGRLSTGNNCIFVGAYSGKTVTTGNDNICLGTQAGATLLSTGNRNVCIGSDTDANNVNQGIAIGYRAIARRNGEIALGDDTGANPILTAASAGAVVEYLDLRVNGQIRKIALLAQS